MNIQVNVFVAYDGLPSGLSELVEKLGQAVIDCGFGTVEDSGNVSSFITVTHSAIHEYTDTTDFAKSLVAEALLVAIPIKGVENDSTGD